MANQQEVQRVSGTVKTVTPDRGYGFVTDRQGREYFFHRSACVGCFGALRIGSVVTFEPGSSEKGPRAERLELE